MYTRYIVRRTQIYLTDDQGRLLEHRSRATGRTVLDTSILIDHLRGRPAAATALIPEAIERGDELCSSYVVRAELLAGCGRGWRAHDADGHRVALLRADDRRTGEHVEPAPEQGP